MAPTPHHFWTSYHSHSDYCDGVESPRAQVEGALRQGVGTFGFSSHGPVYFENAWSMKMDRLNDYLAETSALQVEFAEQIELYRSLEIDYLPSENAAHYCGPSTYARVLDYTIGSVHYLDKNEIGEPWEIDGSTDKFTRGLVEVHGGDIRQVVHLYYERIREMLQLDPPDILGHLDKIKIHNPGNRLYDENASWYRDEVAQTLEVLAETDAILEVNTRGLYKKNLSTYPSLGSLELARQRNIPVMINADSHAPAEITARFADTAQQLREIGFRTVRIFHQRAWQDVAFDGDGLYL